MTKKQKGKTILVAIIGVYATLFVVTWIACGFLTSVFVCAFCLGLPFALSPLTTKDLLYMIWWDKKK